MVLSTEPQQLLTLSRELLTNHWFFTNTHSHTPLSRAFSGKLPMTNASKVATFPKNGNMHVGPHTFELGRGCYSSPTQNITIDNCVIELSKSSIVASGHAPSRQYVKQSTYKRLLKTNKQDNTALHYTSCIYTFSVYFSSSQFAAFHRNWGNSTSVPCWGQI